MSVELYDGQHRQEALFIQLMLDGKCVKHDEKTDVLHVGDSYLPSELLSCYRRVKSNPLNTEYIIGTEDGFRTLNYTVWTGYEWIKWFRSCANARERRGLFSYQYPRRRGLYGLGRRKARNSRRERFRLKNTPVVAEKPSMDFNELSFDDQMDMLRYAYIKDMLG